MKRTLALLILASLPIMAAAQDSVLSCGIESNSLLTRDLQLNSNNYLKFDFTRGRGWDPFTFCFDTNKELARAMKVTTCPHVCLYDKDGNLVYTHVGYSPGDEEILFEKIMAL